MKENKKLLNLIKIIILVIIVIAGICILANLKNSNTVEKNERNENKIIKVDETKNSVIENKVLTNVTEPQDKIDENSDITTSIPTEGDDKVESSTQTN